MAEGRSTSRDFTWGLLNFIRRPWNAAAQKAVRSAWCNFAYTSKCLDTLNFDEWAIKLDEIATQRRLVSGIASEAFGWSVLRYTQDIFVICHGSRSRTLKHWSGVGLRGKQFGSHLSLWPSLFFVKDPIAPLVKEQRHAFLRQAAEVHFKLHCRWQLNLQTESTRKEAGERLTYHPLITCNRLFFHIILFFFSASCSAYSLSRPAFSVVWFQTPRTLLIWSFPRHQQIR